VTVAFLASNFIIAIGYVLIAFTVLPNILVNRWWVKLVGLLFFVTCGITHIHLATHVILGDDSLVSLHSVVNHVVQAVTVQAFFFGLYLEVVADHEGKIKL